MKREILPARPLGLRFGVYVKSTLIALLVLGFAAGMGIGTTWFASSTATISRDKDVWARGVPADGSINGKRRSKLGLAWIVANYEGTVSYTDAEGASYRGTIDFWTMFGGPDTDQAELRYDPNDHGKFAVSWGVEASGARWRASIVMTVLFGLITLAMLFGTWMIVDNMRSDRRIARAGDEIQLRVVSSKVNVNDKREPTGKYDYVLELEYHSTEGDKQHTISKTAERLLHVAPNDARVLALWTPGKPSELIVIEQSLAPLVVTAAERKEIDVRAEAARAG